jgi:hypothetical protein
MLCVLTSTEPRTESSGTSMFVHSGCTNLDLGSTPAADPETGILAAERPHQSQSLIQVVGKYRVLGIRVRSASAKAENRFTVV